MFYFIAYLTIAEVLVIASVLLYKVTFPGCTSRRCTEHTN